MDSLMVGQFIARRRKERNMTQAALAEKIGVSNKSVSKWETGRCLPDYSVVESLCRELNFSASELLSGAMCEESEVRKMADEQAMKAIQRIEKLEKDKAILYGLVLFVFGIALLSLSGTTGGSPVQDLAAGIMLALSIALILAGVYIAGRQFVNNL